MTRRRWIADQVRGNRAMLIGEHAAHLARVLRAQAGQEFDIAADGVVRRGRILSVSENRVEFQLGEEVESAPVVQVTLALAIIKFDRMEWAIEKCTELGIARLIPLITARTESHLAAAATKRVERWQRVAHAASEQSRRVSPPELLRPIKLKDLIADTSGTRIVLSEVEQSLRLQDAVPKDAKSIVLAFGPEGGWKQDELEAFASAGWIAASLGPAILRTETAAIAAVAIASSLLFERD